MRAQLADELRRGIRAGRFEYGLRLPSTRSLAAQLGVSRGVVEDAYAQLAAEGYLEQPDRARPVVRGETIDAGVHVVGTGSRYRHDLTATSPEVSLFPRSAWARATRQLLRELPDDRLGYGDPAGPPEFRACIVSRQRRLRGSAATPDAVIATSGFTQSLDLVCRTLARLGARRVAVEDPGFDDQWATLRSNGLEVVPVPVDDEGIRSDLVAALDPDAVLVTPAHQFPTGAVLTPGRRRELVEWARSRRRLILEDDYDAEFRYDRRPVGALQGLAPDYVVSLGTVAKSLVPGLRIGWIVAPRPLVKPILETRLSADAMPSTLPLLTYAALAERGTLDRHLRRARRLYATRRRLLLDAVPGDMVSGASAGLHFVVDLPKRADRAVAHCLEKEGVRVRTLASYTLDPANLRFGLVIGFGRIRDAEIPEVVAVLRAAIAGSA